MDYNEGWGGGVIRSIEKLKMMIIYTYIATGYCQSLLDHLLMNKVIDDR